MRRWIHPSSFSLPSVSSCIPDLVGKVGFRGTSTESRWREGTSLTREKEGKRKRGENERERERKSLYLGASFICRDLFYDTHARTNSDQLHTGERGPRYCVPGQVEKCDILWQMDGGGSWQRCTFKCDCLFRARLPANTNLWCSAGLSLLAATSRRK